ncbi:hypothetical protein MRX96_023693 [Rhipicephalus microplus]
MRLSNIGLSRRSGAATAARRTSLLTSGSGDVAGRTPCEGTIDSPALQERPDLKTNDECQPCGQRDQSQEKKSKSEPGAEVTSPKPNIPPDKRSTPTAAPR